MAVTLALPLALFGYAAWLSWLATHSAADREISRTLDVAYEHALKVFETIDLSLTETEEAVRGLSDLEIAANLARIHRRMNRLADALPQIKSLWLFDRTGRPLVNSIETVQPDLDFSDRDYFKIPALGQEDSLFVGRVLLPRPPYTGAPFFSVSRRRSGDEFTGVVQASVLPEYFETFYARIAQQDGLFFALGLTDGNVIARHPRLDISAKVDSKGAAGRQVRTNPSGGMLTAETTADGIERRLAYRRLETYPVYVAAGLSTSSIAGRWHADLVSYVVIGLPLTAIVFGLLYFALRRSEDLYAEGERRRQAEEHLRQGQKLEALGHLTGGVAHDFNNLLTVIGSSAELLSVRDLPEERRLRYASAISETVRRASILTDRLLAFARRQPLTPSLFNVAANLDSIGAIVRTLCGPRIETTMSFPTDPVMVRVDASQFETAVINLAANARDAMSGAGKLDIAVSEIAADDRLPLEFRDGRRYARIAVRDSGSGIDPENLAHIFEPFFTTKDPGKGTGLGLSQVFGFARQAEGHVAADSQLGSGSTFFVYLPVAQV